MIHKRHETDRREGANVAKSLSHQQTGAEAMVRESSSHPRTDDAIWK
jgi:hypothetical protein